MNRLKTPVKQMVRTGVALMVVGVVFATACCLAGRMRWSSDRFHYKPPTVDGGIEYNETGSMFYMHGHHPAGRVKGTRTDCERVIFYCRYDNMTAVDVVCYERPMFWEDQRQIICFTYEESPDGVQMRPDDYRIVVIDKVLHRMLVSESVKIDNDFLKSVLRVEFDGLNVSYSDGKGNAISYAMSKRHDSSPLPVRIGYWLRDKVRHALKHKLSSSRKWVDDKTGYEWSYVISNGCAVIVNEGPVPCAVSPRPAGDVDVPTKIGGCKVTGIGEHAFVGCRNLKRLKIPASVVRIGAESPWAVFCGCDNMVAFEVDPANAVYSSYDGCLYDSRQTVLMRCPEGKENVCIREGVSRIAPSAFWRCSKLDGLTIPSSVVEIGDWAFSMTALREIHYLGNAPICSAEPGIYPMAAESLVSVVKRGTQGWKSEAENVLPPKWQGCPIRYDEEE